MGHKERMREAQGTEGGERPKSRRKEDQQAEMLNSLVEEVRNIDSEIDLLKQKINLIIREINVLKRAVLIEKKEIKDIELEEERDKSRFESLLEIVREIKEDNK